MEASQSGAPDPADEPTAPEKSEEEQAAAQEEQDSATPGDQGEQVAHDAPGGLDQSTAVATSAPSPDSQSGVPLPEDREAGVEPGPVQPGDEDEDDERPVGADQTAPSASEPTE